MSLAPTGGETPTSTLTKVIEQTQANDHFIDEHEDSFIINLADDSSTDKSCDDYDSSTETASEGE